MTNAYCETCKTLTEHTHLHNAAHGIEGTHMEGSERYECSRCRRSIFVDDITEENKHLKFILDKRNG